MKKKTVYVVPQTESFSAVDSIKLLGSSFSGGHNDGDNNDGGGGAGTGTGENDDLGGFGTGNAKEFDLSFDEKWDRLAEW